MAMAALPLALEAAPEILAMASQAAPVAKKIFNLVHNKSSRKSLSHMINKGNIKKAAKFLGSSDATRLIGSASKGVKMVEGITGKNTITKGLTTGLGVAGSGLKHYHNLLEKYSGGRRMLRDHFGF